MLWALASSAYVIFLYRKLKGGTPSAEASGEGSDLNAALGALEQRLSSLEEQTGLPKKGPAR